MSRKILVFGSSNVDLVLRVQSFHNPGETIIAQGISIAFGGKGANQALAARRLGCSVMFVTKLGMDFYGRAYRKELLKEGLARKGLLVDRTRPTGMAIVEVAPDGENRIIVAPGANRSLLPDDILQTEIAWQNVSVFLTQLEIPLSTVRWGLKQAKHHGITTLLNPSPASSLPDSIFSQVSFLVPNEWEAQRLTGIRVKRMQDLSKIADRLMDRGVQNVVITLGEKGLFFKNREEEIFVEAFPVKAVDTTAAGDAFMGALACAIAEGKPMEDALIFANAAGALATTKAGAQPSLPRRDRVEIFLAAMSKRN